MLYHVKKRANDFSLHLYKSKMADLITVWFSV